MINNKNISKLGIIFLLLAFSPGSYAKRTTLYYQPTVVAVKGVIRMLTFSDPAIYDINHGSPDESDAYLELKEPVDVDNKPANRSENVDDPEKNVRVLQLAVMHDSDWKKLTEGRCVQLTGKLFHAVSGHHHTKVLLGVDSVKLAKGCPPPEALDCSWFYSCP